MSARSQKRRMALTAASAAVAVAAMTGLAFAAVPLYDMFCKVTGYGGTTQVAAIAPTQVIDRAIAVRFDANVSPDLQIKFTPVERAQSLRLGETGIARYRVENLSDQPVTVVASYNVAPHKAGVFFQKLECFCFQDQTIGPHETLELPVVYYVDPELATDRETEEIDTITLSYTFFRSADAAAASLTQ